jgi:peptide deformylase
MLKYYRMKRLKVIQDPHPILRKRAVPVPMPLTHDDATLLEALLTYVKQSQEPEYAAKHKIREGIGLAAPQVGISKRLIAIYYHRGENLVTYALANPLIVSSSIKQIALTGGEGCLSVPIPYEGYVYRAKKITVKAFDLLQNKDIIIEAEGFDAIVLQHEIDHLNGVLFYDHIDKIDPYKQNDKADLL